VRRHARRLASASVRTCSARLTGCRGYPDDLLETRLKRIVCNGALGVRATQHAIATNWEQAYRHYVGPPTVGD